jgi:hypothetical protein
MFKPGQKVKVIKLESLVWQGPNFGYHELNNKNYMKLGDVLTIAESCENAWFIMNGRDIFYFKGKDDDFYYYVDSVELYNGEITNVNCVCSIQTLMISGCRCGFFESTQNAT